VRGSFRKCTVVSWFLRPCAKNLYERRHQRWFDLGSIVCRSGSRFGALLLCRTHRWQNSMPASDAIAMELRADQLIVDDREGRREAERCGISVIGTLGVLPEAATLKLLDIQVAAERLRATSFYVAREVLARLLKDFAWGLAVTSASVMNIYSIPELARGDRTSA
jgi:hypothetical protein